MGKTDGLSRRPNWKVGIERDNDNQIIIKNNQLHKLEKVVIKGPEVEIIEKIKKAKSKDKEVVRIVEEMKKAKVKAIQGEEQQIKEDLVLKEGKIYVPKDKELRAEIIWLHHDVLVMGHGGKWKTVELVTRNDWQLGIIRGVGRLSSSQTVDLGSLYFIFHFHFLFVLSYFSIFRTARVRVRSDWSHCHLSHNLMV